MEQERCGKKLICTIEADADGMLLGQYLRRRLHFSRAQIRSVKFLENGLLLNGSRVRVSRAVRAGEVLEVQLEREEKSSAHLAAAGEPVEILYEDADLLAVWKESGLVLHPAHGHYGDTLTNRVHAYFLRTGQQACLRSIGRLDRDTSGIVVFAKNQVAAARLWQQKEEGVFWKEYRALCEGYFDDLEGSICTPVAPMPGEKMKMCVSKEGRPAQTFYRVLEQSEGRACLQVRIRTGRTHQIRVHMASVGHPVVGDVLYGTAAPEGLGLCAWKAQLRQPFTGARIEIMGQPQNMPKI